MTRPSMEQRRAAREAAAAAVREAWGRLDAARLGRRENEGAWLWRRIWGRAWARHVARCRQGVLNWLPDLRLARALADREHAWMVLNQNVDRRLANWIRARRGQAPYAPPRPPPSETELAWAAYMTKDGERPIPREEPRPAERMRAPGAPSPSVLLFEGDVKGVEQWDDGRFVAHILSDNGTLKIVPITDAQAKALAERFAAEEAASE